MPSPRSKVKKEESSYSGSEAAPASTRPSKTGQTTGTVPSKASAVQQLIKLPDTQRDPLESVRWSKEFNSAQRNPLESMRWAEEKSSAPKTQKDPEPAPKKSDTSVRTAKPPLTKEDKKPAPEKGKTKNTQKKQLLICGGVAAAVVFIAVIIVVLVLLTRKGEPGPWHSAEMCPNVTKCSKSGYSKPPLLLISIDGFRRDYLDQPGWVTWLKKMAECGVTAEKVFPVYPSKTFPNHYTQVTGLYPTHHGITDNWIWDQKLNKDGGPIHMGKGSINYYKGVPIWKHYMAAGGRANCFFWPGSDQHHCSEYMPYNQTTPIEDRVKKVREWLNLPEEKRPGLLTMYFHHLDHQGHHNPLPNNKFLSRKEVETAVKEMDQMVHDFLQSLADDGIVNCVDIVVSSDHGMVRMEEVKEIEKTFTRNHTFVVGPVSRIFSKHADEFIRNQTAVCQKNNKKFLLTTDDNRSPRYHHSGKAILGDVVLEERLGVVFKSEKMKVDPSSHGYDYLYKEIQTVFFARGPSFRPGTLLPPFQQIEYFNLFLDLLGLGNIQNNGTVGIFDPALSDPPKRPEEKYRDIGECATFPQIVPCCKVVGFPSCSAANGLQLFSSNMDYCFAHTECGKVVYSFNSQPTAVMETLTPINKPVITCYLQIGSSNICGDFGGHQSISADISVVPVKGNFTRTVKRTLRGLQNELLQKTSKVYVLSGTTVDKDRDGIADDDQSPPATHFYRLYVYCKDNKYAGSGEETVCSNKDQLATLGFIFPLIQEDPNCLKGKDLLLYYSARLKDVELISGLRLMLVGYSTHERAVLRTRIVEQL